MAYVTKATLQIISIQLLEYQPLHLVVNNPPLHDSPPSTTLSSTLSLSTSFVTAVPLLFSAHLTTSSAADDVTYPNCTNTFTCGSLQNITYPFTGGDRQVHCGPPDFHLSCRDSTTEFTTNSVTYRVLQINQSEKALTLARSDLWNNTLSPEIHQFHSQFFGFRYDCGECGSHFDLRLFFDSDR
ncbi:LEAF RUST 10 DISEASE-RESISTANCE LOCUS RECEPTOR-LIKE PROTEIN KINASE-like 2.5 [Cornus florida]|uniref:LEAF RUST 10 DISEASE-RESISTANCE LOCUS RECEPTOR-LIKE PROTEIN KINASE-like 2.5 n=1 Tax=Cornus florida TaxID=4283 RepID=UPI0028A03652|nr:LEAF RUST 10 DISEASE-RESISTANCE LOCUS RECEPTOR-LIKE PROTEIN KINASE-like 2.5 [Cornus florida]